LTSAVFKAAFRLSLSAVNAAECRVPAPDFILETSGANNAKWFLKYFRQTREKNLAIFTQIPAICKLKIILALVIRESPIFLLKLGQNRSKLLTSQVTHVIAFEKF
jgi:hypothetical protein